MGYSDQKYYARPLISVLMGQSMGTSTGAGTASNSLAQPAGAPLPSFTNRTKINAVTVIPTVAPNANATALVMSFLNGTSTFATVTLTTATAGQVLTGVMTPANAVFAAAGQPTFNLIGTFTASGGTAGAYTVLFEQQELPTNPGSGT